MWEARRHTGPNSWRPAKGMEQAEVAETSFRPSGWKHAPLRLLIRRVHIEAEELSQDPRSRRRLTVPKGQLQLALKGRLGHTYSYSFLLTDLEGDAVEIEHWHRQRAQVEKRVKDLKLGCGHKHLPLSSRRANYSWQTASVIVHNLIALLAATLAEQGFTRNRNTNTVRRWLIDIPGRVLRGGRRLHLRLAQAWPGPKSSSPSTNGSDSS